MFEIGQLIAFIASLITCLVIFERRWDTRIDGIEKSLDAKIGHIEAAVQDIRQDVRELRRDMSEMGARMSELSVRMAVQDTEFKSYVMYGSRLHHKEESV